MNKQHRWKNTLLRKKDKRSEVTPEVHQENEADSEVEEQLKIGRKIMVKYREVFEKLAKS